MKGYDMCNERAQFRPRVALKVDARQSGEVTVDISDSVSTLQRFLNEIAGRNPPKPSFLKAITD
jgi:hypothetical protein